MKFEMRRFFLYTVICCLPFAGVAQKDVKKYKEEADAIRKEVWSWSRPEFNVRTIPEKYANASAVTMARRVEINADSKKKAQLTGLGFGMYRALTLTEVVRELVKINDKSAVDDYSEISYTQMQKKSGMMMNKITTVYIGVRIIKPNGSVKEINADDIVLTKDEKTTKEAKAAIPDLQVGDMVDYFIAKQTSMEQQGIPPYTFTLFDDNPVMHYSIRCEVGKKYAVEYRCYNNAPDFKLSKGEDDDNVLEMEKNDIPAYPGNNFWVSPYRQLPIIRMNIMVGYNGIFAGRLNTRKPGEIYKNQAASEFIEDEMNSIGITKHNLRIFSPGELFSEPALRHLKKVKSSKSSISLDSLVSEFYYAYRFDRILDITTGNTSMSYIMEYASKQFYSDYLFKLSLFLKDRNIDNKLVLLTSRYGPDMKSIMSRNDIAYMVYADGCKNPFYGVDDVFSPAFYIPYYFENTPDAITLDIKGLKEFKPKNFDQGMIKIPGSTFDQNSRIEQLVVMPVLTKNAVTVKRNTTLKGHYKSDVQKELITLEDYYESERKLFGEEKTLLEYYEGSKKTKKYAEELKSAFADAHKKQKEAFLTEATDWFETEITDLDNQKIVNLGVRHNSPDFVYSSEFTMPGLVKKAGNNFIVEIGKFLGAPLKIDDAQRKRNLDVYTPFARSIYCQISLEIPAGYTAEGVAALNKKIENESGVFAVDATSDGKTVNIKVSKIYKNAFEPHTNWNNMLAFIDAAVDWTNSKLLLKKQ